MIGPHFITFVLRQNLWAA